MTYLVLFALSIAATIANERRRAARLLAATRADAAAAVAVALEAGEAHGRRQTTLYYARRATI